MSENTPSDGELSEKIPTKSKVGYGFANAGNGLLSGLGLGTIDIFYLKITGIDPSLMAISWLLFAIWNAVNDPLIGIIEERTRSSIGRRIPYLRYGSIVYFLTFILIWFPFTSNAQLLFWNHLLMLFIFDTVYSMIGLVTYSLPAEMALTAKERGSIMLYSTFIGAIGVIGPIVLPIIFLGDNPNVLNFRIAMIIVGFLSALMIFLSSYAIKENFYTQMEEPLGFLESINQTLKNKPFLILEISIFAMVMMQNVLTGYLIFITDYILDFSLNNVVNIIVLIILIICLLLAIKYVITNIPKHGIKKLTIIGSILGGIGFGILLIMGLILKPTAASKVPLYIGAIPLVFIIFGMIIYMLMNQPLMADTIDHDEVLTGKRRETTYSGVNALITKPAVSLGKASFLWIIKAFGYVNEKDPVTDMPPPPLLQPDSVAMGVVLAFTLIPIICLVIAAISLKYFPLDGPEWQAKKRELQEIHLKKEREYVESMKAKLNAKKSEPEKNEKRD
jgi:GPH family glycoside/pentoside/hexuronide:cation symporter